MIKNVPLRFCRHRALCFLLPVAGAILSSVLSIPRAAAQISAAAIANATVQPAGPRPTASGTNFFNVEGSSNGTNGSLASFGVLDFSAGSFNPNGQMANGVMGGSLTLSLTETNAAFTMPASLQFYLTTVTGTSISNATGASPLKYNGTTAGDGSMPVFGIDTGLGVIGGNTAGTLFDLGSGAFTTTGATNNGKVDTFTLTLNGALNAFLTQLNISGGNLRLVVASTNVTGAATFFGATTTIATNRPLLSFTPTFAIGNSLNWEGTSGSSWTPTGTTNWSTTAGGAGSTQWINDGTYTGVFGTGGKTSNINAGNINAAGLEFDTDGYVINGTGAGNTLTFSSTGHNVNVVNAADTATVNAPIAGTVGLAKVGTGTLALGGTNTFSGGVNVTGGTLQISADANLGAASNGVTLANGATLSTTANVTMAASRTLGGTSGALNVAAGTTLTVNGDTTFTGMLALTGSGTVTLADAGGRGYDSAGSLSFSNASQLNSTGVLNVGSSITASHTSGTAVVNGNVLLTSAATGTTTAPVVTVTVANANATLKVTGAVGSGTLNGNGFTAANATLLKAGPGTMELLGDNSALTSSSATTATVRQGVAGATAGTNGGTLVVHTSTALGFVAGSSTVGGQYQFNNGTFANASGSVLTFANGMSIGGGGAVPSGASFGRVGGGDAASVFTGGVALFNPTGAAYRHVITVNSPTTFSGQFSVSTGTGGTNGLLITGPGVLTLASTAARNTFTENATIDSATTLSLTATGSLDKNPLVSLLANATLSVTLAPTGGTVDAIGDSTFLDLASGSHVVLNLNGGVETVYGLELNGVVQPAGLYSAATPGGYFTGAGFINNLGASSAVPEPSSCLLIVTVIVLGTGVRRVTRRHSKS